ncbi:MAG: NTP transferase domain-containing protein [Nitrososphaera sp.]
MIAAIMCGGRASRMGPGVEKPLLRVDGMPLVQCVLSALEESAGFDLIFAAVSQHTPLTGEFLASKGVEIIDTSGEGYSRDLSVLLEKIKPDRVFVTPADIPLLSPDVVKEIAITKQEAPAISVIVEKKFVENIGINPSVLVKFNGREYCHSGITIFDTAKMGGVAVQEQYIVMDRVELAVNVNSKEELKLAEKLLIQRAQDLAQDRRLAA